MKARARRSADETVSAGAGVVGAAEAWLPVKKLPVRRRVALSALKMPAPPAGPTRGPPRVVLEPPRARLPRNVLFSTVRVPALL